MQEQYWCFRLTQYSSKSEGISYSTLVGEFKPVVMENSVWELKLIILESILAFWDYQDSDRRNKIIKFFSDSLPKRKETTGWDR